MLFKNNIESRRKKTALLLGKIAAVLSVPVVVYSFGANPPLGHSGSPADGGTTCASCHGTLAGSSGVTVNAPASYTPGGAPVTMTVSVPGGLGFELSILTLGNAQAGTLAAGPPPPNASFAQDGVTTQNAIQYVYSTVETTSWTFVWTPPATNVGNVVVYVTGGTNGTSYANTFVISAPVVTPPPPPPTPTLSASQTPLTFTVNGAAPASQTITVSSSATLTGTVTTGVSTTSGGNWLTVIPPGGSTPFPATVGIAATGLAAGMYQGSVSFTNSNASNSPLLVPVTLNVTTPIPPPPPTLPTLSVNSTGLTFNATVGGAAPASQSVTVSTSNLSAVTFTDSATPAGSWLFVDTAADTTPTSEPISIATVPSTAGTYQGTVTFTSSATSPNSITLPITLNVASATPPPTTGLPWSFNANVVDRLVSGTDYMLLTGNGGMNSTSQLSGSGSFTRFLAVQSAAAMGNVPHTVVANGRWRVTDIRSSNLTTNTTTSSTGVTTTRVTGGTVVLAVSITIQGCSSGGGESEGGAPPPTPSPITGTLTVTSNGGSSSGVSLDYSGTCNTTSSTGVTSSAPVSGTFSSVGIGTYSLGNGGDN